MDQRALFFFVAAGVAGVMIPVIDDELVQLRDPAVRAKVVEGCPPPGSEIRVQLERADPATRTVSFAVT